MIISIIKYTYYKYNIIYGEKKIKRLGLWIMAYVPRVMKTTTWHGAKAKTTKKKNNQKVGTFPRNWHFLHVICLWLPFNDVIFIMDN